MTPLRPYTVQFTTAMIASATPLVSKPLRRLVREMTDKELVLSLCERMGLRRSSDPDDMSSSPHDYLDYATPTGTSIELGAGHGLAGFLVQFNFDGSGKLTGHAIIE